MAGLAQLIDFEFRSQAEIDGWPLIHFNLGANPETGRARVAKGVVAIGNIAYGVVSIGAIAFGVVTVAGIGLGVVSLAGIAMGVIALGAIALGYEYAIGAIVQSAENAIGVIHLDSQFVAWSLILAAAMTLVIWGVAKVRAIRLQS